MSLSRTAYEIQPYFDARTDTQGRVVAHAKESCREPTMERAFCATMKATAAPQSVHRRRGSRPRAARRQPIAQVRSQRTTRTLLVLSFLHFLSPIAGQKATPESRKRPESERHRWLTEGPTRSIYPHPSTSRPPEPVLAVSGTRRRLETVWVPDLNVYRRCVAPEASSEHFHRQRWQRIPASVTVALQLPISSF
jgi:hypothetical protein